MKSGNELLTHRPTIGVILAGGQGRRMGGIDKSLISWQGRTLLDCLLEQLASSDLDRVVLNSNRPAHVYASFGLEVFPDAPRVHGMGLLAGLYSALCRYPEALILTVPCDTPFLPQDYVARTLAAAEVLADPLAVAWDGNDIHPTYCLVTGMYAASLKAFLISGQRRARDWLEQEGAVMVDFSDQAGAFININQPADIQSLESRLAKNG